MLLTAILPVGNISRCHKNLVNRIEQASAMNIQIKLVFDNIPKFQVQDFLAKIKSKQNIDVFCGDYGRAGLARNVALKEVESKWLVFWDSDDDFYPEKVFQMVLEADKKGAFGAIANYELTSESKIASPLLRTHQLEIENQPDFDTALGIWRCAFRTDLIHGNQIEFPSLRVGEDVLFVMQFLLLNPRLLLFPSIIYNYSVGSSLQTTAIRSKLEDTLLIISELINHKSIKLSRSNHELIRQLLVLQCLTVMRSLQKNGLKRFRLPISFSKNRICFICFLLIFPQSLKRVLRSVLSHRKGRKFEKRLP